MDSREFFGSAREAAKGLRRWRRALDVLEGDDGVSAQTYEPRGRSGSPRDPSRSIDRNMAARERIEGRIDAALATIADAGEVCDGIAAANPHNAAWADSVYLYYIDALSWGQVGESMGYSSRHCQRLADAALDWLDGIGMARARDYARGAA